eukprot:g5635.t1
MEFFTDGSVESPHGNNSFLVQSSFSSIRGHLGGGLLSYPKSVEALLSTSRNNAERVTAATSHSFVDKRDLISHSSTPRQVSMHASNPLFEPEVLRTRKLVSRSFDAALWTAKSLWSGDNGATLRCNSSATFNQHNWNALLAFRSQLLVQTRDKENGSEPTSPLGYFPDTPIGTESVQSKDSTGKKYHYLNSSYNSRGSENDSITSDVQRYTTRRTTNSPTEFSNEIQLILVEERQHPDSKNVVTTKTTTVDERKRVVLSTNTGHNHVTNVKRKSCSSVDDQPSLEELWARESQHDSGLRRYRGTSYSKAPHSGRSGTDNEAYFYTVDVGAHRDMRLKSGMKIGRFFKCASIGIKHRTQKQEFDEQRLRLLSLATMPFDHSNDQHVSILRQIYQIYTGKPGDNLETVGQHWKELGFRGIDPALELRSGGILTLMFLLYFHKRDPVAANAILRETKRDDGLYPFASMCVVVTTWVLKMIRKGKFSSIVRLMQDGRQERMDNREGHFILAVKKLFTGLMYKFHWNVTRHNGCILDVLEVSEQVQREMKKDVEIVVRIADLPDILYLGEHLFRRLTRFEQVKQTVKLTFSCFQPKDLHSDEEYSHS